MSAPAASRGSAAEPASNANAAHCVDRLLCELRAPAATSGKAELAVLLPLIDAVQRATAQRAGVRDLMRLWSATLRERALRTAHLAPDEVASAAVWFGRLQQYLHGRLPPRDRAALAQLPSEIADGLPLLGGGLAAEIERRLAQAAPVAESQPNTGLAPDAAQEPMGTGVDQERPDAHGATIAAAAEADAVSSAFVPGDVPCTLPGIDGAHAADGAAAGAPFIWISEQEHELARSALAEDLLGLAQQYADAEMSDAQAPAAEALGNQAQTMASAFDIMGLRQLARAVKALRERLAAPGAEPEHVLQVCAGMLAAVEQPGSDSAALLASLVHWLPALDAAWADELARELARVRIGRDPAALAARKRTADEDDVSLAPAADVLPAVLDGMLRELPGNAARLGAAIRAAVLQHDRAALNEARRVAHTLKGDANTAGVRGLAGIMHALEEILLAYDTGGFQDAAPDTVLVDAADRIEEIADYLLGRGPHPQGLRDTYQGLLDQGNAMLAGGAAQAPAAEHVPLPLRVEPPPPDVAAGAAVAAPRGSAAPLRTLALDSATLDTLQDLAGEAMIVSQRVDRLLDEFVRVRREQDRLTRHGQELLARLDDLVALRGAALQSTATTPEVEHDPLEIDRYNELHVIARQLAEAQADAGESLRGLHRTLHAMADVRSEQQQVNAELARRLLRLRMVPFADIVPRLQRLARQTSKQLHKPVELALAGETTQIDADVLDGIVEPIGHLIRNAIDHGIEPAEQRVSTGKTPAGRVHIAVELHGDTAVCAISDDGRGLDADAIRRRALDLGLVPPAGGWDERALVSLILLPGFSTRDAATEVSGRGVGLDVVNERVRQLRGTLDLHSRPGQGLTVTLRLPITRSVANVVLVSGERCRTAVVAASVEQIVSFAAGACTFDATAQTLSVVHEGRRLRAVPIESVYAAAADANRWLSGGGVGLLLRTPAAEPTLVLVHSVDDVRTVVVKPISALLPTIAAVRGVAQLPDGGLAPVADLVQCLSRGRQHASVPALRFAPERHVPRIVVADDSLSVRRSLDYMLRDAGYAVDVAADGFEAIAQVEAAPTAVLLVDMEMPRMNGLEVARNLRSKPAARDLPIVMITSRTGEWHRELASAAGVTRVMHKPVSEELLLSFVAELVAGVGSRGAAPANRAVPDPTRST